MKQHIKQTISALSLSLLSLSAQAATEGVDYTVLSRPIATQQNLCQRCFLTDRTRRLDA